MVLFSLAAAAAQAPWSRLPVMKTNIFTLIQLACLGSMM